MAGAVAQVDGAEPPPPPPPPPSPSKGVSDWGTLLRLCAPDWSMLLFAFASLAVAASGDALLPALQATALNSVLYADSPVPLRQTLVRLGAVGIGTAIFTGIRGFIFWVTGSRLVARLRATLFEALLKQPQEFHDTQGPGELSTRIASDCVKLGDVLTLNVNIVLRQIIQSVVGLCIVFRVNAKLGALVLAGVVTRAAISSVRRPRVPERAEATLTLTLTLTLVGKGRRERGTHHVVAPEQRGRVEGPLSRTRTVMHLS